MEKVKGCVCVGVDVGKVNKGVGSEGEDVSEGSVVQSWSELEYE